MVQTFDPQLLQLAGIGIDLRHVVGGQERHLVAELHEGKHMLHRRIGTGILIWCGYRIVDEVSTSCALPLSLQLRLLTIEADA